jgi:aryl sulfotransferase
MSASTPTPVVKPTRVYQNHHLDSTRWAGFKPRAGDVVITTPYKCGTTWMQQIVASLVLWPGRVTGRLGDISPWLEARFHGPVEQIHAELEATDRRRQQDGS